MHLESIEKACLAFSEMCRVVKKGGALYAYIGFEGGVIEKYITPALRRAYVENNNFKSLIDSLNEKNLAKIVDRYITFATENDDSLEVKKLQSFTDLITLDTIRFIQNVLQVPVQNGALLTSSWGYEQYKKNNFINIKRMPDTYWQRNDIRKYLAPLHHDRTSELTKILYGTGHVKMMGTKA